MPYRDGQTRRAARRDQYRRDREQRVAAERRRRAENPELFANTKLRYRYGITAAEYRRLYETQGGLCALCETRPAADVDHDHRTGRVRALLCRACNLGLGLLRDDPKLVRRAAEYLEAFSGG